VPKPPGAQPRGTTDADAAVSLNTGYDVHPTGIYQAAAEMGISIPRPRQAVTERAVKCLSMVFTKVGLQESRELEAVWAMVQSIAAELEEVIQAGRNVAPQYEGCKTEERLLWHSVYTAVLAMDLAQAVEGLDRSPADIGAAALLHDVGFLRMQDGMKTCADDLDERYAEHIDFGVAVANEIGAPPEIVRMIAQHHERCDGTGFPAHITAEQFERSSQVLALANVMEINLAASSASEDEDIPSIFDVLVAYRKAFEHDLLKTVFTHKGFYNTGEMVELTNRSICQVVHLNPGFPLRPVVKVIVDGSGNHPETSRLIDLKDVGVLSIARKIT
jgi:putative nucleotidyltransferase with HDIG domain